MATTTQPFVSPRFSQLLSFNAGYVDTAGFLALGGLFTAHVTGNFVTLGATLVHGTAGAGSKLAALPMFCLWVLLTRWASNALLARQVHAQRYLMFVKAALLTVAAYLMVAFGPFANGDIPVAFVAGMFMVAAMAMQNAMQRIHTGFLPPTTLMTGTTTQVMIDVADLIKNVQGEARTAALGRLHKMLPVMICFTLGCLMAAVLYVWLGMWCFVLPPVVALVSVHWVPPKPVDTP